MSSSDKKPSILFVCLGNICRSPMAEGAFRAAAQKAGLECEVASAGTGAYHIGNAPDPRAIATARANGVDIAAQTAAQVSRDDFYTHTHILALDTANLEGVKAHAPRDGTAKVTLLMDMVPGREGEAIKDPYYGDESDFEAVWEVVALAANVLAKQLVPSKV